MKHKLLALLLCLLAVPVALPAQTSFVNLTPKPKLMTVNAGTLALPADFVVSYDEADEAMLAEMNRFVATYNAAHRFPDGLRRTGAQARHHGRQNQNYDPFHIKPASIQRKEIRTCLFPCFL